MALSEAAGEQTRQTAGNATILITESVTYLDKVSSDTHIRQRGSNIVLSASPEPAGGVRGLLRARVLRGVPPHGVPRPQTQEKAAAEAGPEQGAGPRQSRESTLCVMLLL